MECNKRNRNIRYAIFRDSNLNGNSNVLLNRTRLSSRIVINLATKKMFSVFGLINFYIFGRFVKTKYHTFLKMALKCFNRIQITST